MAAISTSCRGFLWTGGGRTAWWGGSRTNVAQLATPTAYLLRCERVKIDKTHLPADQRPSPGSTPSPAGNNTQQCINTQPHAVNRATFWGERATERAAAAAAAAYPCCVLTEVTAFVLYTVGVADPLQKLHLLDNVLPFLPGKETGRKNKTRRCIDSLHRLCVIWLWLIWSHELYLGRQRWKWAHAADLVEPVRLSETFTLKHWSWHRHHWVYYYLFFTFHIPLIDIIILDLLQIFGVWGHIRICKGQGFYFFISFSVCCFISV